MELSAVDGIGPKLARNPILNHDAQTMATAESLIIERVLQPI